MFNKTKAPSAVKTYILLFSFGLLILTAINFNGCLLDALDVIIQEISISHSVNLSGTENTLSKISTFDLDEEESYEDIKDHLTAIRLLRIAYRTVSVSPANLRGDITVVIKKRDGSVLISKDIPNNSPSEYINKPFELPLTEQELSSINTYLAVDKKFTTIVNVTTQTQGVKTIEASVDIVFQVDLDLNTGI